MQIKPIVLCKKITSPSLSTASLTVCDVSHCFWRTPEDMPRDSLTDLQLFWR